MNVKLSMNKLAERPKLDAEWREIVKYSGVHQAVARPGVLKWVSSAKGVGVQVQDRRYGERKSPAGPRGRAPVESLGNAVLQKLKGVL